MPLGSEIRTRYADGGYSGGSTNRPALQRLLAVRARKVVVVYKVNRLTRSLAGFAKLVELFVSGAVTPHS
jgi:site-specific DNA recombinase